MFPCNNPMICGVWNHREGTICKSGGKSADVSKNNLSEMKLTTVEETIRDIEFTEKGLTLLTEDGSASFDCHMTSRFETLDGQSPEKIILLDDEQIIAKSGQEWFDRFANSDSEMGIPNLPGDGTVTMTDKEGNVGEPVRFVFSSSANADFHKRLLGGERETYSPHAEAVDILNENRGAIDWMNSTAGPAIESKQSQKPKSSKWSLGKMFRR